MLLNDIGSENVKNITCCKGNFMIDNWDFKSSIPVIGVPRKNTLGAEQLFGQHRPDQ
jgi:hypothetical protein